MGAVGNGKISTGAILGTAVGLAGTLATAAIADRFGYHMTSQILLVAVAAFGGAVLGALILLYPGQGRRGDRARPSCRAPTAGELQSLINVGCWEWDIGTDAYTWNAGMYAIYGVSPENFTPTQRSMLDFVAPQDVQAVLDTWWKDQQDGPPKGMIECRIVRTDGEVRHVRYIWHAVESDGAPSKVFGIAQDVTALRGDGRFLRHEDAHLRGIVECSADYIWEYRAGGETSLFEGLRLQNFGGAGIAGAGTPVVDGASDHDFGALEQAIEERAKFRDLVVPIIDGNGEPRWVSLSGHPQFDRTGCYYGYRGVAADITDRRRERDQEEDRRQAGAMGRLASGLAHEINNLLQPILIYSACGVDEAREHERLRLYFTRIARAAERATFIVKNILSFARRTPPAHEDLNVILVVRDTLDLMSGAIGGRTVDLVAGDEVLIARAERTGVAQIVTNLIANAADVLPADGRIVVRIDRALISGEVSKTAGVAPGCYCRIAVEDSGPGIAPDIMAKVFDPFFTTKPQGKGTGLGLAVVSGIAKSWGGSATVDSVVGQGSRFCVYLPVATRELQAAQ